MPPYSHDEQLIESVAVRRARLTLALLFGTDRSVRTWSDRVRTFVGSAFIAVLACALCVGISWVTNLLAEMREQNDAAPAHSVTLDARVAEAAR